MQLARRVRPEVHSSRGEARFTTVAHFNVMRVMHINHLASRLLSNRLLAPRRTSGL